jgi:TRAP-type uncharacterized transport system substrate-binding protein
MPRRRETPNSEPLSPIRPATTPDDRESQMIALADQLAEQQLRDGTASAQVITHFLKLGSSRERLEQAKLQFETKLVEAKTEAIAGQQRQEEMFAKAIRAMRSYQGLESDDVESFDEEDYYEG